MRSRRRLSIVLEKSATDTGFTRGPLAPRFGDGSIASPSESGSTPGPLSSGSTPEGRRVCSDSESSPPHHWTPGDCLWADDLDIVFKPVAAAGRANTYAAPAMDLDAQSDHAPFTPPASGARLRRVGTIRQRRVDHNLALVTQEGSEAMEPVRQRCVVCGAVNSHGMQRRSGWKCTGCVGTKHTMHDADWLYRQMPSYLPKGATPPPATAEERIFRAWVTAERGKRRRRGREVQDIGATEFGVPPVKPPQSGAPDQALALMWSLLTNPTTALGFVTTFFAVWLACHSVFLGTF
eukprot:TRINITY_DN4924_c0_g6_i1.p1 TRINITY_DN4924_c0_g6~~TRINITY_DN4924_c0_g6_i1.p1  ORF type:complete len:293 (+),score=20.84 TRINITY_DN4924_c0_g6_i1:140-1018(+)